MFFFILFCGYPFDFKNNSGNNIYPYLCVYSINRVIEMCMGDVEFEN